MKCIKLNPDTPGKVVQNPKAANCNSNPKLKRPILSSSIPGEAVLNPIIGEL
jgi:hypothetical protein